MTKKREFLEIAKSLDYAVSGMDAPISKLSFLLEQPEIKKLNCENIGIGAMKSAMSDMQEIEDNLIEILNKVYSILEKF